MARPAAGWAAAGAVIVLARLAAGALLLPVASVGPLPAGVVDWTAAVESVSAPVAATQRAVVDAWSSGASGLAAAVGPPAALPGRDPRRPDRLPGAGHGAPARRPWVRRVPRGHRRVGHGRPGPDPTPGTGRRAGRRAGTRAAPAGRLARRRLAAATGGTRRGSPAGPARPRPSGRGHRLHHRRPEPRGRHRRLEGRARRRPDGRAGPPAPEAAAGRGHGGGHDHLCPAGGRRRERAAGDPDGARRVGGSRDRPCRERRRAAGPGRPRTPHAAAWPRRRPWLPPLGRRHRRPAGAGVRRAADGCAPMPPPGCPRAALDLAAVSLVAQAASLPLVLVDFGQLSPVAPIANILVAPLVPPVVLVSLVALATGGLLAAGMPHLLGVPIALAGGWLLGFLAWFAHQAAAVPFATILLDGPAAFVAGGLAAVGLLAVAQPSLRARAGRALRRLGPPYLAGPAAATGARAGARQRPHLPAAGPGGPRRPGRGGGGRWADRGRPGGRTAPRDRPRRRPGRRDPGGGRPRARGSSSMGARIRTASWPSSTRGCRHGTGALTCSC